MKYIRSCTVLLVCVACFGFLAIGVARASTFQVDSSGTLSTNLAAYYKLEDENDSAGSGYNLTNINSVAFDTGKIGNAASGTTNNTNKRLSITNNLGISTAAAPISISAWVNVATAPGGAQKFVGLGESSGKTEYFLRYENGGSGLEVQFWKHKPGVGGWIASYVTTLTPGTWYHLVGTYDGNDTVNLFIGSSTVATTTGASGNGVYSVSDGFSVLSAHDGSDAYASARVDEVGVWNKKLSNQEVVDLYNGGAGDPYGAAPSITSGTLQQYRSNATTTIPAGSKTDETIVVFGAKVNATNSTGTAQLQVEVRSAGVSFTDASTTTSVATSSGNYITTGAENLDPGSYHWQARVLDNSGATSTWQSFSTSSVDFIVDPPRSFDLVDYNYNRRWSASNTHFSSTDPFTIEFWYKTDVASTTPIQILTTKSDENSNGFAIWREQNGINFSLTCGGVSSTVHLAEGEWDANNNYANLYWHHVAIAKAGATTTDTFKLYFDGEKKVNDKQCYNTGSDYIWIGGNPSSSMTLFNGQIDEVRIWNTERSVSDIATSTYEIATSTELLGLWRFNNTSTDLVTGNTVLDGVFLHYATDTPFGHFLMLPGTSAVNTSSYEIQWASSTQYSQEWEDGLDVWKSLEQITVISTTSKSTADLIVDDVSSTSLYWLGLYCDKSGTYWCFGLDHTRNTIYLNSYQLSAYQYDSSGIQSAAMHEFGHALGLGHSIFGNIMLYYIIQETPRTTLGTRDAVDYHFLWDH